MAYKFNPFTGTFDEASSTQAAALLDEVDVVTTPPSQGKLLKYTGNSKWEPGNTTLDELTDTDISTPEGGASLVWNGAKWVVGPVLGGVPADTDAAAIIPFNGSTDNIAGSLYPSFSGSTFSSNVAYSTSIKKAGTSSFSIPTATAAGIYYANIDLRNFLATNNFTIEFWMYATGGGDFTFADILMLASSNNATKYVQIMSGNVTTPNRLDLRVTNAFGVSNTNTQITYNSWNHIAFTHDSATKQLKFFVNGVYAGQITAIQTLSASNTYLHLGAPYNGSSFNGTNFRPVYYDSLEITPGFKYTSNFVPAAPTEGAPIPYGVPLTNPTGITGASRITNIIQISQTDYDAIATPDSGTLYVIV